MTCLFFSRIRGTGSRSLSTEDHAAGGAADRAAPAPAAGPSGERRVRGACITLARNSGGVTPSIRRGNSGEGRAASPGTHRASFGRTSSRRRIGRTSEEEALRNTDARLGIMMDTEGRSTTVRPRPRILRREPYWPTISALEGPTISALEGGGNCTDGDGANNFRTRGRREDRHVFRVNLDNDNSLEHVFREVNLETDMDERLPGRSGSDYCGTVTGKSDEMRTVLEAAISSNDFRTRGGGCLEHVFIRVNLLCAQSSVEHVFRERN